jgi:hypothetical protein
MKKIYAKVLAGALLLFGANIQAQRYVTEVFTDAQISVALDQTYAQNYSVLPAVLGIGAPESISLRADIYHPTNSIDTAQERPLIVYIPTGNFLPPVVNGSPTGSRKDSSAVNMAKLLAKRGYVVAVIEYRLGWDPTSPSQIVRTGTILNAAYKGMQDSKAAVRFFRNDRATVNTYKINPNKIALIGEGTGGYIAMAHAFLNSPDKIGRLPGLGGTKFLRTQNPDSSVIDTNRVGNFNGTNNIPLDLSALLTTGDLTKVSGNIANNPGYSSDVNMVINMGGALGDSSWIDRGQVPMIGIHAVRDPNAPYQLGPVAVPTSQGPLIIIPWASGAGNNVERANFFDNNASFANKIYSDPITSAVESVYGTSIQFNGDPISVGSGKGLLPFILPEAATSSNNHGSPWQFWNSNQPSATQNVQGQPFTTHQASAASNPFMAQSNEVGRATALTYIDTIQRYINPRIVCALGLAECDLYPTVGINEIAAKSDLVNAFPNPANNLINLVAKNGGAIRNWSMFDLTGKMVLNEQNINTNAVQISRGNLASGLYLIRFETNKGVGSVNIVIE